MKPPAARLLTVAGALLAVLSVGCVGSGPTSFPAVTVHVVNRLSNVVVTSSRLIPATGSENDQRFVLPCGGQADVRATMQNSGGGLLVLSIDPTGEFDSVVAQGSFDPSDPRQFPGSIIWSTGLLKDGEWVLVEPAGVSIASTAPTAQASATCAAWPFAQE